MIIFGRTGKHELEASRPLAPFGLLAVVKGGWARALRHATVRTRRQAPIARSAPEGGVGRGSDGEVRCRAMLG